VANSHRKLSVDYLRSDNVKVVERHLICLSLAAALVSLAAWTVVAAPPKSTARAKAAGWIQIDGSCITKLVFDKKNGGRVEVKRPGVSVALPPGEYCLRQVELEHGCSWRRPEGEEKSWFTVAGTPHRLTVGAPLTAKVQVTREGRSLQLEYQLLDAAGREYRQGAGSSLPAFHIAKAGREIASGRFRYG
jgi:hypothetical protein